MAGKKYHNETVRHGGGCWRSGRSLRRRQAECSADFLGARGPFHQGEDSHNEIVCCGDGFLKKQKEPGIACEKCGGRQLNRTSRMAGTKFS